MARTISEIVEQLNSRPNDELFSLIEEQISRDQEAIDSELLGFGFSSDVSEIRKRVVKRFNNELHGFICGEGKERVEQRNLLSKALGKGEVVVVTTMLASILISIFAVNPAIAIPLAEVFRRVVLAPTGEELCSYWAERLEADIT